MVRVSIVGATVSIPLSWKAPSDLSAVLCSGTGRNEHMEMGVESQKISEGLDGDGGSGNRF